jgi:hypothetical protein
MVQPRDHKSAGKPDRLNFHDRIEEDDQHRASTDVGCVLENLFGVVADLVHVTDRERVVLCKWRQHLAEAESQGAAAYAERGDFARAVEVQANAQAIYKKESDLKNGRARLEVYKAGKPLREATGGSEILAGQARAH